MVRRHRDRPDDTVVIVVLLDDRRHGPGHADAVASHDNRMVLHIFIFIICSHGLTVLGAQLEHLSHFDAPGVFDGSTADRAGISLCQDLDICHDIRRIVASVIHVLHMMVQFACSRAQVFHAGHFAVHHDRAVVQPHRSGEAADAAGRFVHLLFISEFDGVLRNVQRVDQFGHVQLSVAAHKGCHVAVFFSLFIVFDEEQRFQCLLRVEAQVVRDILDGLGIRGIDLFDREHLFIGCGSIGAGRPFGRSCHVALFTVGDLALTDFGKGGELMGVAAADGAGVRLDRPEGQAASGKDLFISLVHDPVTFVQSGVIPVEGVSILHDEFTAAHQSESGAGFVSVFCLDLIEVHRQLTVGRDVVSDDISEDLLVSRPEAEVSAVSVLETPKLRPVGIPSAGFLPKLRRLDG